MSTLSSELLESIRGTLGCPALQIFANGDWGSDNPEYRNLLRQTLATESAQYPDLKYSSISHTTDLGVLILSPHPIGVDIEIADRPTDKVVARVSSPVELSQAPRISSLWCAKEAAFKALRTYNQPPVISDISIGGWEKIDSHTETFRLTNARTYNAPSEGLGIVVHFSKYAISFFIFTS